MDHAVARAAFRAGILPLDTFETSLSRIDHKAKSIGFRSGLEGGHKFLSQKPLKWLLHHVWETIEV